MSIYRIPITKDTTISTWSEVPTLRNFGNAGASQIADVWAEYRNDLNLRFLTRLLAEVSLTGLQAAIASGQIPDLQNNSSVSANLKFFNINHGDNVAYEFSLQVFPVTRAWQEGRGTRIDSFTNTGYANWISASNTADWTNPGGDFVVDSSSSTQWFESGAEDLNVDVSKILKNWLAGSSANYGLVIKMDSVAENLTGSVSTSTQYYRKAFHGRLTNYPNFAPYVQLQWNSVIQDSRKIAQFGQPVNLYFYNAPNANYTDIDGITIAFPGSVTISGLSAWTQTVTSGSGSTTSLTSAWISILTTTASHVKTGVYCSNFLLPVTASLFNQFSDVWTVSTAASAMTLSTQLYFHPTSTVSADTNFVENDLDFAIPNWHNFYNKDSLITKKVYFFEKSANVQPLVQSEKNSISSIASSTLSTYVTTNGWWRVVVPALGTVDVDWQPLEYDSSSNFFTFDVSNFARQIRYQLEFKTVIRGETIIFDDKNLSQPYYFEVLE
jgi:hypothetical protein